MSLTPEEIENNWNKFESLCGKLGDRTDSVKVMLSEMDERLATCPASARTEYHGAFPGGLVDHSLRVLNRLVSLNTAFGWRLSKQSMILSSLFHDVGKVGMPGKNRNLDFYVEQSDDWKRKRGDVYAYNNDLQYLTTPDRSVFIMQHYGVRLTAEEWLAIRCNDGFVWEPNKAYCLKISPLVYGVMTADYIATMDEKQTNVWQTEKV